MKYKIAELFCVVAVIVFIAFSLSLNSTTEKSAEEIGLEIAEQIDISGLAERDGLFFKKTFDRSADEFDSVMYYSSDDVMNVSEMLVIKLADASPSTEISEQIEEYVDSRYDTFAAYAPEQGKMLKNHVLKKKGNVIFMYIGSNEQAALDAFNSSL